MKKIGLALLCGLILSYIADSYAQDKDSDELSADMKLSLELSKCVKLNKENPDKSVLDEGLLRDCFFPFLDLKSGDEIIDGQFGRNTDACFLLITIKKVSNSGKTIALFEVGFDFVKKGYPYMKKGTEYGALDGMVVGDKSNMLKDMGFVNIYDLGEGHYLINGPIDTSFCNKEDGDYEFARGQIIGNMDLQCLCCQWSPEHTTSNLIRSGLTVGKILEKRLENLESLGDTGKYMKDSKGRFETFRDMRKERGEVIYEFNYKTP